MSYAAKIIADSTFLGSRLTTFVATFPRIVLAEFNTHRMFSRNSASSRAIPTERLLTMVDQNPFIPESWGSNQAGMQAGVDLSEMDAAQARMKWLEARDEAVRHVRSLYELKVHKQLANRLLEPWMWTTVIVTSSTYENFFKLRCHPAAQPEIRKIADMMRDLYEGNTPRQLYAEEWHLPLVPLEDQGVEGVSEGHGWEINAMISAARCARVSYTKHEAQKDLDDDMALAKRLSESGHWSPFEHQAKADRSEGCGLGGNLGVPWEQFRKTFDGESGLSR